MSKLHLVPPPSLNQFCSKPHLITHAPGLASSPDLANSTAATHHLLSQGEPAKSISKTMQVHALHEGRSRDTNYSTFSETKTRPVHISKGERCHAVPETPRWVLWFPFGGCCKGKICVSPRRHQFWKALLLNLSSHSQARPGSSTAKPQLGNTFCWP